MKRTTLHKLIACIPPPRFQTYLAAANGDEYRALELYRWNIDAAAAVTSTLSVVEIALRDTFDQQLRAWNVEQGGSEEWIVDPRGVLAHIVRKTPKSKDGNGSHRRPGGLDHRWWEHKARQNMKDHLGETTLHTPQHDDLVASLSFGSWTSLIPRPTSIGGRKRAPQTTLYDRALSAWTNTCNPESGFSASPEVAFYRCAHLRYARNRAAHLEPLLDQEKLLSWHRTACRVTLDLSSGAAEWITGPARIPRIIDKMP